MIDLYVATVVIGCVAVGAFEVSRRRSQALLSLAKRRAWRQVVFSVAALALYVTLVRDKNFLLLVMPYHGLPVSVEWHPIFAAIIGGSCWGLIPGGNFRRLFTIVPLLSLSAFALIRPLFTVPPECSNVWEDGVCLQTSPATCTPACAATLLRAVGIDSDEEEMASLCLTDAKGTTVLGLIHGLHIKTLGTSWRPEVFTCSADELPKKLKTPLLLSVGFDWGDSNDRRYVEDWGWTPGQLHSAVLFRFIEGDLIEVGDPAVGREHWRVEDLQVVWKHVGVRLVSRN